MSNCCNHYLELRGQKEEVWVATLLMKAQSVPGAYELLDGSLRVFHGEQVAVATLAFSTGDGAGLGVVQALMERCPTITATMIWYGTGKGLRGYAVFQPGQPPVIVEEQGLNLLELPRLFPDHYPCPLGSDAWAAADPESRLEAREESLLQTGQPYWPVREAVTYVPLQIEEVVAPEGLDPQA